MTITDLAHLGDRLRAAIAVTGRAGQCWGTWRVRQIIPDGDRPITSNEGTCPMTRSSRVACGQNSPMPKSHHFSLLQFVCCVVWQWAAQVHDVHL